MTVMGTRGSALALAQAGIVGRALGLEIETRVVRTAGDASDRPIPELGDGAFVTALEEALRRGEIDLAVHSLKDVPTGERAGLVLAAILARDDPRDAVITRDRRGPRSLRPGAIVGTSSPRRDAFLRSLVPGIVTRPIRGNVDTRIGKVQRGEYDAVVLAVAGMRRLGIPVGDHEILDPSAYPPAPGQGALAVQCRDGDAPSLRLVAPLDDAPTRAAVTAERVVLRELGASCEIPLGAWARPEDGTLVLDAAVATGGLIARARERGTDPEDIGRRAAARLGAPARA
jgi:hydroxymethylbilane synthase